LLASSAAACSVADLTAGDGLPDATGDEGPATNEAAREGATEASAGGGDVTAPPADGGDAAFLGVDAMAYPAPTTAVAVENALNLRYLDVANNSTSDGAQVWAWSYTGGSNQYWTFMPMGDGSYEIVNQASGKCIDDPGSLSDNGRSMQQYTCWIGSNDNQRWYLVQYQGSLYIVGKASGKCLASTAEMDGATVYIWDCAWNQSEQWLIVH
jgi:hypothetical protein